RLQREVEPLLVRAADTVGDGLGQPVRLRPDHLGAEDEAEVVDAAEGVAPGDADEGLGSDVRLRLADATHTSRVRRSADERARPLAAGRSVTPRVLVAEVHPQRPGR